MAEEWLRRDAVLTTSADLILFAEKAPPHPSVFVFVFVFVGRR
jgi:hypothetical protein